MIYRITHSTTYQYEGAVSLSHHVLRLRPRDLPRQRCVTHEIQVEPRPDVWSDYADYFGNGVTFVTIEGSHKVMAIHARSQVEIILPVWPAPARTPPWEAARNGPEKEADGLFLAAHQFTYSSPLIRRPPEFAAYAAPSFPAERPVLEAVLDLTSRIHADFKFDKKATHVATPLLDVFKKRRGVCQDFAQLEIGFLRAMGIPARYVSGYLETTPPPGQARLTGADASHAWVSFHCPGLGWVDVDPTNNLLVTDRHLTVAWGRDYSDISPVRGIIVGGGEHTLEVAVDVIPVPSSHSFDAALLGRAPKGSALPQG
jgi:transglutaminase-like putative cysteine protease